MFLHNQNTQKEKKKAYNKKSQQVTSRKWVGVKYERKEAVKVQRGKERVMMRHMWCPGGNPRIPQSQAERLWRIRHHKEHRTSTHASSTSRGEHVYSVLCSVFASRLWPCLRSTAGCTSSVCVTTRIRL